MTDGGGSSVFLALEAPSGPAGLPPPAAGQGRGDPAPGGDVTGGALDFGAALALLFAGILPPAPAPNPPGGATEESAGAIEGLTGGLAALTTDGTAGTGGQPADRMTALLGLLASASDPGATTLNPATPSEGQGQPAGPGGPGSTPGKALEASSGPLSALETLTAALAPVGQAPGGPAPGPAPDGTAVAVASDVPTPASPGGAPPVDPTSTGGAAARAQGDGPPPAPRSEAAGRSGQEATRGGQQTAPMAAVPLDPQVNAPSDGPPRATRGTAPLFLRDLAAAQSVRASSPGSSAGASPSDLGAPSGGPPPIGLSAVPPQSLSTTREHPGGGGPPGDRPPGTAQAAATPPAETPEPFVLGAPPAAPPAAPGAAPVDEPARLAPRSFEGVVAAIRVSHEHQGGEVRMQLWPEQLGEVRIHVAVADGQLHARIQAGTVEAREALVGSLPQLRDALDAQGIRVGRFEVQLGFHLPAEGERGGRAATGSTAHPRGSAGLADPESEDAPVEVARRMPSPQHAPGRLDIRI